MGSHVVKLPDVGEGVAEAEIIAWRVSVGDTVGEDDAIVEVMTDKATVELPSPVAGTVARLGADVGDIIPVGSELIWIDVVEAGSTDGDQERASSPAPEHPPAEERPAEEASDEPAAIETPATAKSLSPPARQPREPSGDRPLAAPAVRKRAKSLGVELAEVAGTGPDGRIGHDDLDAVVTGANRRVSPAQRRAVAPTADEDEVETVKVVGLRRNIAARMQEAYRRIPHFTYVEEVDVTEVERLRTELNERRSDTDERSRLTLLPFLMRAVVVAVGEHPQMNARFQDDEGVVQRHRAVHLGIAVQTPKGLMVPVVKHADGRDLWDCADEVARLSEAARAATVTLEELSGSTITITSLGALGGLASTPIINAPEVAIIGVNKIAERPVHADGSWLPRKFMNLSSSFDHRVIDGWDAAQFIQSVKGLLEQPALLFMTS